MTMKFREVVKLLAVYVLLFVAGSFIYVLGVRLGAFDAIAVFFYRGLVAILAAGILMSGMFLALKLTRMRNIITIRDVILFFFVFSCVHVVLFTHLPVTADRSVSVFMLGYMNEQGRACSKAELETAFIDKYVNEYEAFDKRLFEQIYTGTIDETSDGEYELTDSGRSILDVYDIVADWYGIDKKLIHP